MIAQVGPIICALAAQLPAGHPKLEPDSANAASGNGLTSEKLIEQLDAMKGLATKEKTFDVAAAIGRLYYSAGRYADASQYLEQAVAKGEPARRFFVKLRPAKAKPEPGPSKCQGDDKQSLEALVDEAQKWSAKDKARAFGCASLAWERVAQSEKLLARSYFLTDRPAKAISELDSILKVSEADNEATFARAAVLYDSKADNLAALSEAKRGFEKYIALSPQGPRAAYARALSSRISSVIAAGGISTYNQKSIRSRPAKATEPAADAAAPPPPAQSTAPALSRDVMEAIANTERTPELEKNFEQTVEEGEEHLARGRYEDALIAYRNVMPYKPGNARVQAGMAWALFGLNKPMAPRVWDVAVSTDPSAVEQLGDTLKKKGDAKGANALFSKLAESNPAYAEKAGLRKKIQ